MYTQRLPTTVEDLLDQRLNSIHYQHRLPRITPPNHIFTPLVHGYTQSGQFDKARGIFMTMRQWDTPINQVTYVTLMKLYLQEKRYDVVETIWEALRDQQKSATAAMSSSSSSPVSHVYLDGLGDTPLPRWNHHGNDDDGDDGSDKDDRLLSAITDDKDTKLTYPSITTTNQQQPGNSISPFLLSIYLDSLMEQDHYDAIDSLWTTLTHEDYAFDEQNWNRYTISFVKRDDVMTACKVAYRHILEADEQDIPKHFRPGDKTQYFLDDSENHHQLHRRTCAAFAQAFDIAGHHHMGERRLRSLVLEKINHLIKEQDRKSLADTIIE
jgi:pentatricopeptide repeat protein